MAKKKKKKKSRRRRSPQDVDFRALHLALDQAEKDIKDKQPNVTKPIKIAKLGSILTLIGNLRRAAGCQTTMVITFD